MVCEYHTLKCRNVTYTKSKLTRIKQVASVKVLLDYFWINFSNNLTVVGKRLIGLKFGENFGSLQGFGMVIILDPFQELGKYDSLRQWLNRCVK